MMLTKVKGHATEEHVAEGKVRPEDKEANDGSDEAVGKRSTDEQKALAEISKVYAGRCSAYDQIATRLQKFLIVVKIR